MILSDNKIIIVKLIMIHTIYILLGANLGDPISQLDQANQLLNSKVGKIIATSSIYESEAWGVEDQPVFYNQVLCIETLLQPTACLHICQEIELQLGRIREKKWGARIIDIDILYFNNDIIDTETLQVPHPYIHLRNFTLVPLVEIAPDYMHAKFNKTNAQLLLDTADNLNVKKIDN